MSGTGFIDKCEKNAGFCAMGMVIGAILVLICYFAYTKYERFNFNDPYAMDPTGQALLAYHLASDPISSVDYASYRTPAAQ
jgi:hypothetical protein